MPKVLAYLRVSTIFQEISIEVQREQCRMWFQQNRTGETDEYLGEIEDIAISGSTELFSRPNGQHILTMLDRGDTLVVSKLSRAFRSTIDALQSMKSLREIGIRVVVLDMAIDTETPVGRLTLTILAGVMEFERELISERTREAMAQRRREGQWIGRAAPPGWRLLTRAQRESKDNALVTDDNSRAFAYKALERVGKGEAAEVVASSLELAYRKHMCGKSPLNQTKEDRAGKYRISERRVIDLCVYALCGFPRRTQKELIAELGFNPFNVGFIRETYPDYAAGTLELETV